MSTKLGIALAAAVALGLVAAGTATGGDEDAAMPIGDEDAAMPIGDEDAAMPFGGEGDVEFARRLWESIEGYQDWLLSSDYKSGASPHGEFVRLYYSVVVVDGVPHHVIVKDNFGGEGSSLGAVASAPSDYLVAVTAMVQMESGYDPDNEDRYWVKYRVDGQVDANPMGVALAGRVSKGMDSGCIACHASAAGDDYVFMNDDLVE